MQKCWAYEYEYEFDNYCSVQTGRTPAQRTNNIELVQLLNKHVAGSGQARHRASEGQGPTSGARSAGPESHSDNDSSDSSEYLAGRFDDDDVLFPPYSPLLSLPSFSRIDKLGR